MTPNDPNDRRLGPFFRASNRELGHDLWTMRANYE